jgi:hypothetical protein
VSLLLDSDFLLAARAWFGGRQVDMDEMQEREGDADDPNTLAIRRRSQFPHRRRSVQDPKGNADTKV